MFDLVMPAALKDIDKACNITIDIGIRIGDGITYACLGGEMNDGIKNRGDG